MPAILEPTEPEIMVNKHEELPGQQKLFPEEEAPAGHEEHYDAAVGKIRGTYQGMRITVGKAPQTRQWDMGNKAQALAAVGGGDMDSTSIISRLLDPKIESVAAVNAVIAKIDRAKYDPLYTLPHVQAGVRLVKIGHMETLNELLARLRTELSVAAGRMYDDMDNIRRRMQLKLGKAYKAANYDYDPREQYYLSWRFEDVYVPSYLEHNAELYRLAQKQVDQDLREIVREKETQMAQMMFETIDRLLERLESSKLLDGKYAVQEIKSSRGRHKVTYVGDDEEIQTIELEDAEFNHRVVDDDRKKVFQKGSVERIFTALDEAERQLRENNIGGGEMAKVFQKTRSLVRGQDAETLAASLRQSDDFRERMHEQFQKVGQSLSKLAVIQPRRRVMLRKAASEALRKD